MHRAAFCCFVQSNTTVWHDGYTCIIVRSIWGHPPQTCYTRESELKDETEIDETDRERKTQRGRIWERERGGKRGREKGGKREIRSLFDDPAHPEYQTVYYHHCYHFLATFDILLDRQYDRKLSLSSSLRPFFATLRTATDGITMLATFRNY